MSYGATLEGLEMCRHARKIIKIGTCCCHAEDARLGDFIIMEAGANDVCIIDADEYVNNSPVTKATFEIPLINELTMMQTARESEGNRRTLRKPIYSKSTQLTGFTLPKKMAGEMETAGKVKLLLLIHVWKIGCSPKNVGRFIFDAFVTFKSFKNL